MGYAELAGADPEKYRPPSAAGRGARGQRLDGRNPFECASRTAGCWAAASRTTRALVNRLCALKFLKKAVQGYELRYPHPCPHR